MLTNAFQKYVRVRHGAPHVRTSGTDAATPTDGSVALAPHRLAGAPPYHNTEHLQIYINKQQRNADPGRYL